MSTSKTKDTTVSEEIKSEPQNIYEALMLAQSEMEAPTRTELAKGEKFSYTYAPLDVVIKVTKPLLRKYGLVIMQTPINDLDLVGVKTTLAFKDGTTIDSQLLGRPVKPDPQGIGSLITYYRRYAWMAVCGIAPEDDDAQSAMPEKKTYPSKKTTPQASPDKPISEAQVRLINTLLSVKGKSRESFHKFYGVESINDMNSLQASEAITKLKGYPDKPVKSEPETEIDLDEVDEALSRNDALPGAMYEETIQ